MTESHIDKSIITLALVKYAGIMPRTFDWLLKEFGSPESILGAKLTDLEKIEGLPKDKADRVISIEKQLESAAAYKEELNQREIYITTRYDDNYPRGLFEIHDPPLLIYYRGKLPDSDCKMIAVTGAENSTQEGIALTTNLVKQLIEHRVQLISSLATGIDGSVHIGSKGAGGHSFALIDNGFDKLSSDVEIPLAIDILNGGGILTEYAPEVAFDKKNYKQSNRLIAGISQAVIVTEIYQDSTRTLDMLEYCNQIGKLCFILIDPAHGALSDESSLAKAVEWGAIPMNGLDKIDQIVKALV